MVKLKRALNIVLTNLLYRHFSAPGYYIRLSRNKNDYKTNSRLNPNKIGWAPMMGAVDGLEDSGFIEKALGFRNPETQDAKQTRIRPTAKLTELLQGVYLVTPKSFENLEFGDPIVLKDRNKKRIDYTDDTKTRKMRKLLYDYNKLLGKTDITLSNNVPDVKSLLEQRRFDYSANRYHRSFNNESFKQGGRFYGPWWQAVPGNLRQHILINGNMTIELDYSAMHVHLLYGFEGKDYYELFPQNDDPYILPGYDESTRGILKLAILLAINEKNSGKAIKAITYKLMKEGLYEKGLDLADIIKQFSIKHPLIEKYLYSEIGLQTQYADSCVAEYVIKKLTDSKIACLCVHDSFIVEQTHKGFLNYLMTKAFEANNLKSTPLIK